MIKYFVDETFQSRVMQVQHVWALCRDMEELDPLAGWKLIEQQQQAQPLGF